MIDIAQVLAEADVRRDRSRQTERARASGAWGVGPSDVGDCRRWIMYRERPPADYVPLPEDAEDAIPRMVGSLLHDRLAATLREVRPDVEVELDVHVPGLDVPGHTDLFEEPVVTDWKFVGSTWKWERVAWAAADDDVSQTLTYGLGLAAAGRKVEAVRLVYLRLFSSYDTADDPRVREHLIPYDEGRALAAVDWLHGVIERLDAGSELPRDRRGPDLDGLCRRCPARAHCWDLDRAAEAKRTAYGWIVAREDPQVEAVLAAYDEARAIEKDAKREKEAARNALDGVERGQYGAFVLGWNREWTIDEPDPVLRAGQLEREMREAIRDGRPPVDPDLLPVPTVPKKRGGAIKVTRA